MSKPKLFLKNYFSHCRARYATDAQYEKQNLKQARVCWIEAYTDGIATGGSRPGVGSWFIKCFPPIQYQLIRMIGQVFFWCIYQYEYEEHDASPNW